MRTPVVDYAKAVLSQAKKTSKMEKELRSFGRPVKGGYMMTSGDMLAYFNSKKKKR